MRGKMKKKRIAVLLRCKFMRLQATLRDFRYGGD